jgi:NAD(P)-dependent dehydrogenase (short-subunit alcohol dehydrogenase family)
MDHDLEKSTNDGTIATTDTLSSDSTSMICEGAVVEDQSVSHMLSENTPLNGSANANANQRKEEQAVALADEDPSALVPQLSSSNITYGELRTTIKVMNAIAALNPKNGNPAQQKGSHTTTAATNKEDGIELYKQSNLRPFRKALSLCMEMHQRTMYNGIREQDHYDNRKQERSWKRQKMSEKDLYWKHIEATALRKGRVDKLQAALQEYEDEERYKLESMMIPDGHVDVGTAKTAVMLTNEKEDENNNGKTHPDQTQPVVILPFLRACYVCKIRYRELHFFYDQLCPTCAALNYEKRFQTTSMEGRVAVVTGARVKIGFQTCLKLLRAKCTVIATTRFPNAAVDAYRKESDFHDWKHLLFIYGLDLRDVIGIEIFTRYVKQQFATTGIDIIINNACQTIRRPSGYYRPAIQKEQALWENADSTHKALLSSCIEFEHLRRKQVVQSKELPLNTAQLQQHTSTHEANVPPLLLKSNDKDSSDVSMSTTEESRIVDAIVDNTSTLPFKETGISHSAAMSQMIILPEDVGVNDEILPPGISDINGQQLDLRTSNSWLLKMEQVSTPEFMECMYINAMAPFVLNSRLKPLMTYPNDNDRPDRYIINVSAMEGKVRTVLYHLPPS